MKFIRKPDWVEKMNEAIEAAHSRPFDWGGWTCGDFVAAVIFAMTGDDPTPDYHFCDDQEGVLFRVAENDRNLFGMCKRILGKSIMACHAKRGDVVLARGGKTIGICIGRNAAFVSDDGNGVVLWPMSMCTRAFSVGW